MKSSLIFFVTCLLCSLSLLGQDDFWSSKSKTSTPTNSTQVARHFLSNINGLSVRRSPESIDVEQPADLKKEKTNWDKLVEKGEEELSNYIEKEIKNQVKKAVTKEFGKAVGQQAGKAAGAILNKIAEDKAKQEAAAAERERLAAIERRKNLQISIMGQLQQQVITSLVDNSYGLQANQSENFFFFVNQEENHGISFSLFNVFTNGYNQLPYKVDLVKEYKQKSGKEQAWLYGPFPSLNEAKSQIKDVAETAYLGFYEIRGDVEYSRPSLSSGSASPASAASGDFWGNADQKKVEKKEETTTDFWGVKKMETADAAKDRQEKQRQMAIQQQESEKKLAIERAELDKKLALQRSEVEMQIANIGDNAEATFSYRLYPGLNFKILTELDQTMTMSISGTETETKMTNISGIRYEVIDKNSAIYTLQGTYYRVGFSMNSEYYSTSYDSDDNMEPGDAAAQVSASSLNKSFQFKMNALGTIIEVSDYEELVAAQVEVMPSMGDYYAETMKNSLIYSSEMIFKHYINPMPENGQWEISGSYPLNNVTMNSSYEFISMSPNEATLSVNAIIPQTTTEVMGTSMDIGGNQTGTLTIDPLTGLLKSMNIEQTTQLGVAGSSETITEANIKITRDN